MRATSLLLITTILAVGGCAQKRAIAPEYAGIARAAGQVSGSLDQARAGSSEVRALHRDSMGILDRLDHKAVILLEQ